MGETLKKRNNGVNIISSTENEEVTSNISVPSVTNVARLPVKKGYSKVQTILFKNLATENFPAQRKPTHPLMNSTKADIHDDLSEDEIYSGHEGSAHYELSLDINDREDLLISQESDTMSEGSSDMQLNMHLALENDTEYLAAIEIEFEEQIDEAFLEVNNKVPRLLQTNIASNNKLSNEVTTADNEKESPVETDITSDQFLIDFTN